jgi:hypothetical protein
VKTPARRQPLLVSGTSEAEGPLSPARAFVVQFREEPEAGRERFTGRVEHMVSGRAARFHSSEELLAFFTQVLNAMRARSAEEPYRGQCRRQVRQGRPEPMGSWPARGPSYKKD